MAQKTMYPAVNNSPATTMMDAISEIATVINLESTSYLPDPPNLATLGSGDDAEVVLYTAKAAQSISGISRGFNGTTAKAWPVNTPVYRAYTAYDHDAFIANINQALEKGASNEQKINETAQALETAQSNLNKAIDQAKTDAENANSQLSQALEKAVEDTDAALEQMSTDFGNALQNTNANFTNTMQATQTEFTNQMQQAQQNFDAGIEETQEQDKTGAGGRDEVVAARLGLPSLKNRMLMIQTLWNWSACNTGKIYSVSYDNTTNAHVGTRGDDAAGMSAAASTDTVKGANDFDSVPIFHSVRANGYVDASGEFVPTAIEGEPIFSLDGSNGDVWVLFKTCFFKLELGGDTDRYSVSDEPHGAGWFPTPGAIRPDGTLRPFIAIAAYRMSLDADGMPVSVSGKSPQYNVSHNNQITTMRKKGNQYCGQTSKDMFHLTTLMTIEYATRHEKSIVYGCLSYSYQYTPAVTESGVQRIILSSSNAANVIVGSCVSIGNPTALSSGNPNVDRGQAGMHAKANRVKVTKKETLSDGNVAVYVDNGGVTFNTTANTITVDGASYNAPTYITSMPWWTGNTDGVLGPTGSPGSLTSGKYDMRYRYVETVWGNQYVVLSDEVRMGDKLYTCYDCTKFSTSLTDDYEQVGYALQFDKKDAWTYISKLGFDPVHPSVIEPTECNATSTTGYCSAYYISNNTTSLFAVWAGCSLNYSSAGGPRARNLNYTVTNYWWYSASRLSATGRCGRVADAA